MMYPQKSQIVSALNPENIFSETVRQRFLKTSKHRRKEAYVDGLKDRNTITRYFLPISSSTLTALQWRTFRELKLLQLEECINRATDQGVREYFEMIQARYVGVIHTGSEQKLLNMINKREVQLVEAIAFLDVEKDEMKDFLTVLLLFGDPHYIYSTKAKEDLDEICRKYMA